MKNFEKVIGVTMLVAVIVVIGAFVYHSLYGSSRAASQESKKYALPLLHDTQRNPKEGIAEVIKQTEQTVPEAPVLTDDNLMEELQKIVDDNGAADLEALKEEAAGL